MVGSHGRPGRAGHIRLVKSVAGVKSSSRTRQYKLPSYPEAGFNPRREKFSMRGSMSFGVFVHLNEDSKAATRHPVGYIIQENGCWDWVGSRLKGGYGAWSVKDVRSKVAHRVVFERANGPISEGMQLDHLCRNRLCVNPAHLEVVDNRTNVLRGVGLTAVHAHKKTCSRGHSNWGTRAPQHPEWRRCLDCEKERWG